MSQLAHVQKDIGSSGRFGEFFIGLVVFVIIGGAVLATIGSLGMLDGQSTCPAGSRDAITSGALFIVMGVGFTVFGAVAILSGWDRHHDHED